MRTKKLVMALSLLAITLALSTHAIAQTNGVGSKKIKHVLLLSIDGMHAVDFYNCANGIAGVNGGEPYCPNMASLVSRIVPTSVWLWRPCAGVATVH